MRSIGLTLYGPYTLFSLGLAKQLSLSSTTALILGLWPPLAAVRAVAIEMGTRSKVDTVERGRHIEECRNKMKALIVLGAT